MHERPMLFFAMIGTVLLIIGYYVINNWTNESIESALTGQPIPTDTATMPDIDSNEAEAEEPAENLIAPEPTIEIVETTETTEDITPAPTPRPTSNIHAIAMHGMPKYDANFAHFDYVNPDAPKNGSLRMATIGTFNSLNGNILNGDPAIGLGLIYDTLTVKSDDEPFTQYGLLASSFEIAPDNSWIIFNLRPEARWHDGVPITVDDVIFTLDILKTEGHPFYSAYYANVISAERVSEHQVKFSFDTTDNAELPLIMGQLPILPRHYWENRDFSRATLEHPLGSGPYRIDEVSAGQNISYSRVEDYWGRNLSVNIGRYNFDEISYQYYRDTTVLREALFSGAFDFWQENTAKDWATSYDAPAIEDGRIIKEEIHHQNPTGMQAFIFNTRRPIFSDIKTREALSYAFDFEWSNSQFAYDAYTRTDSYFSNSSLASSGLPEGRELEILENFREQIPEDVFTEIYTNPTTDGSGNNRENLQTAVELLREAGWKLEGEGDDRVLTKEDGTELEFEILLVSPAFERWVLPFQQNLERLGAKVSVTIVDSAQYQRRLDEYDFDMVIGTFGQSQSPGNEQRDFWGSTSANINGSRNIIGISDPVIDRLIDMIIAAPNRTELEATTKALDRILLHRHYVIPQWYINTYRVAYWNHLTHPQNMPPYALGITDLWWDNSEE